MSDPSFIMLSRYGQRPSTKHLTSHNSNTTNSNLIHQHLIVFSFVFIPFKLLKMFHPSTISSSELSSSMLYLMLASTFEPPSITTFNLEKEHLMLKFRSETSLKLPICFLGRNSMLLVSKCFNVIH